MGIILWTTVPGGISGSTAVELNGVSGLDALVVFLESRDVLDGGSYIFEYPRRGSSGGGTNSGIPGCTCSPMPNTINMVSSKPASNNGIFQSATLQFGPTPGPLLPVVSAANSYLSTTTFFDTVLAVSFYYFLTCVTGQYVLTRVYETSPFGSPFRDSVRYKWTPGFPGNSCGPPFTMTNGQIFLGGDSSCIVTLSG
jgi:hypothetical protein